MFSKRCDIFVADFTSVNFSGTVKKLDAMAKLPTGPKQYKDGFYIEVCDRESIHGIKISSVSHKDMMATIKNYEHSKRIIILGEHKDGKWLSEKKVYEKV